MKQKLFFTIIALLTMALKAQAGIVITENVVDLENLNIRFVGENVDNNYRYTLYTYEWADRGPQFQISIEAINVTMPAQFTGSDLTDQNYWEPLFRRVTKEFAGEEMTAEDNVKNLFVNNVALLSNQFSNYKNINYIDIEASGNYTIPDGCFSEDTKLKTFICNVSGTLTLGANVVSIYPGFTLKVNTEQSANAWKAYRTNTGANFIVDDSGVVSEQQILSVTVNTTFNNDNLTTPLPNQGGNIGEDSGKAATIFSFNNFKASTTGDVTELYMEYAILTPDQIPEPNDWKRIYAANNGIGEWEFSGPAIDILSGLQSNTTYTLMFNIKADMSNYNRIYYPSNEQLFIFQFTTDGNPVLRGDLNGDGVIDMSDVMFLVNRILNGKFPDE